MKYEGEVRRPFKEAKYSKAVQNLNKSTNLFILLRDLNRISYSYKNQSQQMENFRL